MAQSDECAFAGLCGKDASARRSLPRLAVVGRVWLSAPELDPGNIGDAGNVVPTALYYGCLAEATEFEATCFEGLDVAGSAAIKMLFFIAFQMG